MTATNNNPLSELGDRKLLILNAGGDAGYSAYAHLKQFYGNDTFMFVDRDIEALLSFRDFGLTTKPEDYLTVGWFDEFFVLPTFDNPAHMFEFFTGTQYRSYNFYEYAMTGLLDKADTCQRVMEQANFIESPNILEPVVIRQRHGSGSKGLIKTYDDVVVTQKVNFEIEFVIDVNTYTGNIFPRMTHRLKHGADTHCTLVGHQSPYWEGLQNCVKDVSDIFNMSGIYNLQVGYKDGTYWFIELNPLLSGASWLNLIIQNNIFFSVVDLDFCHSPVNTHGSFRINY